MLVTDIQEPLPLASDVNTYPFVAPVDICSVPPIYIFPEAMFNAYGVVAFVGAPEIYTVLADPVVLPVVVGVLK